MPLMIEVFPPVAVKTHLIGAFDQQLSASKGIWHHSNLLKKTFL